MTGEQTAKGATMRNEEAISPELAAVEVDVDSGGEPAPMAFDPALNEAMVLKAVEPYIQ